jgi:hypothetical protein
LEILTPENDVGNEPFRGKIWYETIICVSFVADCYPTINIYNQLQVCGI